MLVRMRSSGCIEELIESVALHRIAAGMADRAWTDPFPFKEKPKLETATIQPRDRAVTYERTPHGHHAPKP